MPFLSKNKCILNVGIALLVMTLATSVVAQRPTLVSGNRAGTATGNGSCYFPSVSDDGRFLVFQSNSSDLVLNDNNNTEDAFVRDLQTGVTSLISINQAGTASGNRGSGTPVISANGRYVTFVSNATDLVSIPASGFVANVFVRDLVQGVTTLVSIGRTGNVGGGSNSISPIITPDGRFVSFISVASNLVAEGDSNGTTDVFIRDLQTATTKLVSINSSGTSAGNRGSGSASVGAAVSPVQSADGRFVAFRSQATDLVSVSDTNNANDVFVRDMVTGVTTLVSINQAGTGTGNSASEDPFISADGRLVGFGTTSSNIVTGNTMGSPNVFVRDMQNQTTALVSVDLNGAPGGGNGGIITPSGRSVVFGSYSSNLVPNQLPGHYNVFVRDFQTSKTKLASPNTAGTGGGNDDSQAGVISDDGRFVAFQSRATNLVTLSDANSGLDIFVRDMSLGITTLLSLNNAVTSTGNNSSVGQTISGNGRLVAFTSYASDLAPVPDTNNSPDAFAFAIAASNPIDDARFFVHQLYLDFLNREPDQAGWNYWTTQITECGLDALCVHNKRVDVANAFFYEQEYQQTGAYVHRLYRAAFGNNQPFPNPHPDTAYPGEEKKLVAYQTFAQDRAQVVGGPGLAQSQLNLANAFVRRPEFSTRYPAALDGPGLVDAVLATINNDIGADLIAQRQKLIDLFNQAGGGNNGRGSVLYRLADDNLQTNPISNRKFIDAEYNRAFVATQYYGYLKRNPDLAGFLFWLGQVSSAPLRDVPKQHAMVCSFITSTEYQQRFSSVVTHSNAECPQ